MPPRPGCHYEYERTEIGQCPKPKLVCDTNINARGSNFVVFLKIYLKTYSIALKMVWKILEKCQKLLCKFLYFQKKSFSVSCGENEELKMCGCEETCKVFNNYHYS